MHRLPIAGQVALTLLLLAGAGAAAKVLLAKVNSLQGFDPDHVFCMPVRLPIKAITKHGEVRPDGIQELITEQETVRSAVAQAPGVAEAGLSPVWYPGIIANDTRIEIKSKDRRTQGRRGPMQKRVEFEIRKIRGPDKCSQVVQNTIVDALSFVLLAGNCCGLNPFRPVNRALFFVEENSFHTVWVPLQSDRSVFEVWHQHRRNSNVVVDNVCFCESAARIEYLLEIRDR